MAAVMEAKLDRSPSLGSAMAASECDGLVDEHLLAEERALHQRRLEAEASEQDDDSDDDEAKDHTEPGPEGDSGASTRLLELVGQSQLYSNWLADQFKDVCEATMAEMVGDDKGSGGERPAKRAKTARGKVEPTPSATQRLLPLIHAEMRDYQIKGVVWLISLYKNGVNGILADEMGLGKTLQTIGFISYLWTHCKDTDAKYMVVGPLSTLTNWVSEFERFCPAIPVLLYHGTPQEREALRRDKMSSKDPTRKAPMPVIITSYEIVMADRRHLERHKWKLVVVDEGHRLKNFDCKLMRELRCLDMESRLLLTGTPLQNNLRELFSLLSFCMPMVFQNADQFLNWFDIQTPATAIPPAIRAPAAVAPSSQVVASTSAGAASTAEPERTGPRRGRPRKGAKATAHDLKVTAAAPTGLAAAPAGQSLAEPAAVGAPAADPSAMSGSDSKVVAASASGEQPELAAVMLSRLHTILKPFVLRRIKADVNIGVPPKQEMVLYAPMTDEQRRLTKGLIDGTLKAELSKEATGAARSSTLNNLIMQMRKVCNHPDLITGATSGTTAYPSASELVAQCGKLALLDRLLKELRKEGHRVLIFSQMTEVLNVLEAYLQDLGIEALRIDGSVPWQQRKEDIAEFQSGKSNKWVFLLSTRAGGLGINLTAADTVIIYDSDWNPHQDSQAMDRCHRIGQSKPVLVFRLVTANSVENRMLARAESKKALERIVIKKGAFKELLQSASSTSADELVQLLNPDRSSGDLAQSGVVSDSMLLQLLDRSHLALPAAPAKARAGRKPRAKSMPAAEVGSGGPPMPPYPLVGVGYEVVLDEPRRAVGLLQTIDGDEAAKPDVKE